MSEIFLIYFVSEIFLHHVDFIIMCLRLLLRILTGKNHRQIKLQRLPNVGIWAFKSLGHQITLCKRFLN